MRYRDMGPGWVFVPLFIILLITILFVLSGRADALEAPPCPAPDRPIHYSVFCLSETEYQALIGPEAGSVAPDPQYVSPEGLVRVIADYFWPDWAVERMVRIAKCESGFVATAVNPRSGTTGIWQLHPLWQKPWPGDYKNPWTNGAVAYQVWLEQGFRAWACKG